MASVVSEVHEFGADRAINLSQLSEAERRVLRLLAQGHTAKSIASALSSTPTAINERLRQARRKTGVGSSREVARLLTAHENRHDKIEVAPETGRQFHGPTASGDLARFHRSGAALMIIALVAALGIATYFAGQPPTRPGLGTTAINDPIVGRIPPSSEFGTDQLYSRVRAEQRDPNWAPQIERRLRDYLTSVRYVDGANNRLRVMCGSSLCEAAGVIDAPTSKQDESSLKSPLNRTMQALQGKDVHDFAARLGLDDLAAAFQSPDRHSSPTFLIYFQRKH